MLSERSTPASKFGSDAILMQMATQFRHPDQASPEQIEICSAIHLPLDEFEFCVLPSV